MEIKELIKIECDNDYKDLIQDAVNYLNERLDDGNNNLKMLSSFIVADMLINSEDYYKNCYNAKDICVSIMTNFEVNDLEVYPERIKDALYILRGYKIVRKKEEEGKRGYLLNVNFLENAGFDLQ